MDRHKLKLLIEKTGKSVKAIQDESGLKSAALYRLLSGERKDLTLLNAFYLADALNVDVNELRMNA